MMADAAESLTSPPHGGRLVAERLRAHDVEALFALGGGHIVELLDGCIDADVRVIGLRHECAVTMAAEGFALATGRAGVAAVTAGPGFTNAMDAAVEEAIELAEARSACTCEQCGEPGRLF